MRERAERFSIQGYLEAEARKDLFRFSTAGSVDDGKSTLIGRLLLDSGSVYEDQVRSVEGRGTAAAGVPDLALLTDGLRAEREAGITIDVAYRYFATERRKFILADTPGHEQYTRNMVTGASTADAVVILVDATRGVLPQTRRHSSLAVLLGVRHVVLAVNKMDRVGFGEERFRQLCEEFAEFFSTVEGSGRTRVHAIPVSALRGDGVVRASAAMPWFTGDTLLGLLETLPAAREEVAGAAFRMGVQRVVRAEGFRGYAGQITSGTVRAGDRVEVQPEGGTATIARIVLFGEDLAEASAPRSVTVTLLEEIDLGRGALLAAAGSPATASAEVEAFLVWMDEAPLACGRGYLVKHLTRTIPARVSEVVRKLPVAGAVDGDPAGLRINEIALVRVEAGSPLAGDVYAADRTTGSFVLIDPETNGTVAAGMITRFDAAEVLRTGAITAEERRGRFGHGGAVVALGAEPGFAESVERSLFAAGANVVLWRGPAAEAELLAGAGLLVLVEEPGAAAVLRAGGQPVAQAAGQGGTAVESAVRTLRRLGLAR